MNILKQIKRSKFPKYLLFRKNKNSIAIIGTRRGGTTFLANLLSDSQTRIIDQPLEAFDKSIKSKYINFKKTKLPPKELHQFFKISEEDDFKLRSYFEDFEKGSNSFVDLNYGLFKSKIVYKFTFGGYFYKSLSKLNIKPLILFRHPYTQAISCVRNSWSNYYPVYLDSIYFKNNYLNDSKYEEMLRIDKYGTPIEKAILDWYCSNAELLQSWKDIDTVFYENIVTNPDSAADFLESKFDIIISKEKFDKPSGSSFLSEKKFNKNIHNKDFKINHLNKYFKNISDEERINLQNLFDILEIKIYSMYSHLPLI